MLRMTNTNTDESVEFEFVRDFVEDCMTDEMVEEFYNDVYGSVEIAGFKFEQGTLLRKALSQPDWEAIVDDYIDYETESLEDEISSYGESLFLDWAIKDLSWED